MAKIDRDVETQKALTEVKSLKIRAEGEGQALIVDAQARAAEVSILAKAEYVIAFGYVSSLLMYCSLPFLFSNLKELLLSSLPRCFSR